MPPLARYAPGLAGLLHYEFIDAAADLGAGLAVAAVALPVGIAYAELPPGGGALFEHLAARRLCDLRLLAPIDRRARRRHLRPGRGKRCSARGRRPGCLCLSLRRACV